MSILRKILCLFTCGFLLSILLLVLLDYNKLSIWGNHFQCRLPVLGFYLSRYVFWASLIAVAVLLLAMLIIVFYPRTYLEVPLATDNGQLLLKKSALESFVSTLVETNHAIQNPKVRAVLYKKKCRIRVVAQVGPSDSIIQKVQYIQEDIVSGLNRFFGMEHPVKLYVEVTEIRQRKKTENSKSRVR